ncbi:50S ribosomal protein L9, putative [Babesia ovata]|uniref:50S ribosomal protein L9, putative n=1 Tax=Babesia ovata TaxID=189622 RepID=A0A2H6K9S0_9APIC|nr:50S ribosomal protein L9, putative [Babesia ovata]GBE59699.1 50S ribosomal protein L9, putative [Babesia ovata]
MTFMTCLITCVFVVAVFDEHVEARCEFGADGLYIHRDVFGCHLADLVPDILGHDIHRLSVSLLFDEQFGEYFALVHLHEVFAACVRVQEGFFPGSVDDNAAFRIVALSQQQQICFFYCAHERLVEFVQCLPVPAQERLGVEVL